MLTLYSSESGFKKKLTVVVIWLVALTLSYFLVEFILSESNSIFIKIPLGVIGLFGIVGILLRCKIARGVSLVILYFIALFPLLSNLLVENGFIFFASDTIGVFSSVEALLSNLIWAILFLLPIYFFSNDKAMDIFYIDSNPKEHIVFITVAILLILLYLYFLPNPFLV